MASLSRRRTVSIPSPAATPPSAARRRPYPGQRAMTSVRGALSHPWLYSVPPATHGRRLFDPEALVESQVLPERHRHVGARGGHGGAAVHVDPADDARRRRRLLEVPGRCPVRRRDRGRPAGRGAPRHGQRQDPLHRGRAERPDQRPRRHEQGGRPRQSDAGRQRLPRRGGRRHVVARPAADRPAAAARHRRLHLLHDETGPGYE